MTEAFLLEAAGAPSVYLVCQSKRSCSIYMDGSLNNLNNSPIRIKMPDVTTSKKRKEKENLALSEGILYQIDKSGVDLHIITT